MLDPAQTWAPRTEIYLHFAARAEHLERTILPALADGVTVVCDRFADSTMAYQGFGLGAETALITALTALLPVHPDLTLVLDATAGVSDARLWQRDQGLDRYERMDAGFHVRVRAGYRFIADRDAGRCVLIPADGTVAEVEADIRRVVTARLTPG